MSTKTLNPLLDIVRNGISIDGVDSLCLRNYVIALACVAISCAVIYTAAFDANATKDRFYTYALFGILPFAVGAYILSPLFSGNPSPQSYLFYGIIAFTLLVGVTAFYSVMNERTITLLSSIMYFLFVLAVIVGLAILYKLFTRTIMTMRGWGGFVLRFLFYIPCLLIDLLETLFSDLRNSPRLVVVLFVLEVLVFLGYVYAPRIVNMLTREDKHLVKLMPNSTFLHTKTTIARNEVFLLDKTDKLNPEKNDDIYRRNYSISMWIYLNPMPKSHAAYAKETAIFNYGNSGVGKPRISYYSNEDGKDKYILYLSDVPDRNGSVPSVTVKLPGQKWNYFAFTYNDNAVDVFVNGNLEKTFTFETGGLPTYNPGDSVTVGDGDGTIKKGGLYGAICNVKYYKEPISQMQVVSSYNTGMYKNPPTDS